MTGERLESTKSKVALAHYMEAIKVFKSVEPHLRFIKSSKYQAAKTNVLYYKALSSQKLWYLSKNRTYLNLVLRRWQRYLDYNKTTKNSNKSFLSNAMIYFKQARAEKLSSSKKGSM